MFDSQTRRLDMFVRVKDFGERHATDFSPTLFTTQLFTSLKTIIGDLDSHSGKKVSSKGKAMEGTANRADAREDLRDALEAMALTARVIGEDMPNVEEQFRVPRNIGDQLLLAAARGFAAAAAPLSAEFIKHEMPPDFLAELNDKIAALEEAIGHQSDGIGERIAAAASIEETIENGLSVTRKLDAAIRNKYRDDPAVLAEWTSASHTERGPRRQRTATPPSTPATPPAPPAP